MKLGEIVPQLGRLGHDLKRQQEMNMTWEARELAAALRQELFRSRKRVIAHMVPKKKYGTR